MTNRFVPVPRLDLPSIDLDDDAISPEPSLGFQALVAWSSTGIHTRGSFSLARAHAERRMR
jgi:hypothetical protein